MSSIQKLTATMLAVTANLQEVNDDLNTIFGTPKAEAAESAPEPQRQKKARAPQRRQYQRRKPVEVIDAPAAQPEVDTQALEPVYPVSRKMTEGERKAIRAEWRALPKREQTAEKRAEFALRHRCSRIQIFAITRDDGHTKRISRLAGQKKRMQSQAAA